MSEWTPEVGDTAKVFRPDRHGDAIPLNVPCKIVTLNPEGCWLEYDGDKYYRLSSNILPAEPKQEAPEHLAPKSCCYSCGMNTRRTCDFDSGKGCWRLPEPYKATGCYKEKDTEGCHCYKDCWQPRPATIDADGRNTSGREIEKGEPVFYDTPPEELARRQREEAKRADALCERCGIFEVVTTLPPLDLNVCADCAGFLKADNPQILADSDIPVDDGKIKVRMKQRPIPTAVDVDYHYTSPLIGGPGGTRL